MFEHLTPKRQAEIKEAIAAYEVLLIEDPEALAEANGGCVSSWVGEANRRAQLEAYIRRLPWAV